MQSLRTRLAASHILPILVLMPVLGLYLLYSLEGFFTENLLQQLTYQAYLLRDAAERNQEFPQNPGAARDFVATIAHLTDARVVLLSQDATILASTRPEDADRIGTRHEHPSVAQALRGEMAQGVGPGFTAEVAYVVLPLRRDGGTIGALRLSYEVEYLRSRFNQLQWLVLGSVALTAILGLGLGLGLATTITRPLRQLSESAQGIAAGNYRARVDVRSRDEVGALARSFNQMVERLEEADHARERQLAAIVHELARPLAGMCAAVETLRDSTETDPEMHDALLAGIEEETRRLERLIGTLQGLHKRTVRPLQLNRTEVSLERVIRASVVNFEPAAAKLGITLSIELPPHLPEIRADEDRLVQVLTNLLDNSMKFTPREGHVTVHAGEDTSAVWVSVTDTGVGIARDELPHIFQQFYRGDESRPPEKRGMGLGLAICHEIITAHHGRIVVESEPGKGARFTFWLPKT
jgi:signal transduction histidine kinase